MKRLTIVLGIVALVAVLVVAGMGVSTALAQGWRGGNMMGQWPAGAGMMGSGWQSGPLGAAQGRWCGASVLPGQGEVTSLGEAKVAVEGYLQDVGYTGLEVEEVMEFDRNYYAIAVEKGTGIGAMEVLVEKSTGAVGPEPGPNMMWNAKYGMMGRGGMWGRGMMGGYSSGEMTVTAQEAEEIGQQWLDANQPGRTAGEADAFYGYYTLHFLKDGQVDGMLSVHGATGAVWYHSWHGSFVGMMAEQG